MCLLSTTLDFCLMNTNLYFSMYSNSQGILGSTIGKQRILDSNKYGNRGWHYVITLKYKLVLSLLL